MNTAQLLLNFLFFFFFFVEKKNPQQVNSLIAGGVAGAVVATGTRSWTQVIGMAGMVSALCAGFDYSGTS